MTYSNAFRKISGLTNFASTIFQQHSKYGHVVSLAVFYRICFNLLLLTWNLQYERDAATKLVKKVHCTL